MNAMTIKVITGCAAIAVGVVACGWYPAFWRFSGTRRAGSCRIPPAGRRPYS